MRGNVNSMQTYIVLLLSNFSYFWFIDVTEICAVCDVQNTVDTVYYQDNLKQKKCENIASSWRSTLNTVTDG